jgi:hypothetical protein
MCIIQEATLKKIPPLYAQEGRTDPTVYAKLKLSAGEGWVGYITEAEPRGHDYVVFGLFIGAGASWGQIALSKLEEGIRQQGLEMEEDISFSPATLSSVTGQLRYRSPVRP